MKLVHGVGINDLKGFYNKKFSDCHFYRTWQKMLGRCYDSKYQKTRPSYRDCCVCNEWQIFSNFKSWMEKQDWEGKCLDKDILGDGKIYSPNTCIFVSKEVNNFLTDSRKTRGEFPVGVSWSEFHGKFRAYCSNGEGKNLFIGFFEDPYTAHKAYLDKKLDMIEYLFYNESPKLREALKSKFQNYKEGK